MDISKIHFAYFTPIMLTRKIVYNIVSGARGATPTEQYNLTSVKERARQINCAADELLIAAVPTFGGRVPIMQPALLRNLNGYGSPAVVVVSYGSRGYDDTLLEMVDILRDQGFVVFAAAAFVTMHSMATKLGQGRPNAADLQLAREFGQHLRTKLEGMDSLEEIDGLPGKHPYKDAPPPFTIVPTTNEKCVLCMQCYRWCPVDAIPYNNPNHTEKDKCILCHGCIVRCPVKARTVVEEDFQQRVRSVEETFGANQPVSEEFL